MNIIEAIKERRSVRSYNGTPLTPGQIAELQQAIAGVTSPFGGNVTIRLRQFDLAAGFRPSTYGMVRGATDYFLLGFGEGENTALTAGYSFEQIVLKAWQMGLGTCWIAATFKGTDFDREGDRAWPEGEKLRIISPVGTVARPSVKEKLIRMAAGSNNRKPFDRLFFDGDFSTPLSPASRFGEALEMLRLAPSSTNSQPWRVLVAGDAVHFYCKPKSSLSVIDCGIGLCHFHLTEQNYGRKGTFRHLPDAPAAPGLHYLTTYLPA